MALLDIEGLGKPILKEKEKDNLVNLSKEDEREDEKEQIETIFREKAKEKLVKEIFLQDYILYNSNIIIIVIGILTFFEQTLLNRIRNEISRNKINKPLFIIHNLMTYTTEEQVEDYIMFQIFLKGLRLITN